MESKTKEKKGKHENTRRVLNGKTKLSFKVTVNKSDFRPFVKDCPLNFFIFLYKKRGDFHDD